MTQLDLFAPCTSLHVQVSTQTRTPPPRRTTATDPELWATLAHGHAATLALLQRRHPADADAQARALEEVRGPSFYRGPIPKPNEETGVRYGVAHVLAWRIRNGKGATA